MIEITFDQSACGSLKVAQNYGKGSRRSSAGIVFACSEEGRQPSEEELRAAQRAAEERARREWEEAIPLNGSPADVYDIDLALCYGSIAEADFKEGRRRVLEQMYAIWPREGMADEIARHLKNARENFEEVCRRCAAGEAVRIWYSSLPHEMCGLYWLLAQLRRLEKRGEIFLVKLPDWEYRENGDVVCASGCGSIGPGEWGRYLPLQQPVLPAFLAHCAQHWSKLQEENAPLRVVLNGQLVSAAEDVYDGFILRELARQDEEFMEARFIGDILGRHQPGIGDGWLAIRMEEMIRRGELEVLSEPPEDGRIYRRMLRKRS